MGNKNNKAKDDHTLIEASDTPKLIDIVKITDLIVDHRHRHSLPIPRLPSRLASATVFSFKGVKRDVVMLLIVLSRSSRAYIIT